MTLDPTSLLIGLALGALIATPAGISFVLLGRSIKCETAAERWEKVADCGDGAKAAKAWRELVEARA